MNGEQINQKIRYGYAKAAAKLGSPYELYRATTPFTPIDPDNLIGTLPMVASQDWSWMKANRPGNAIWFACIDGQESSEPLSAQEDDYLVGNYKTYFVLTKEYQLPMQVVECNKVVNIIRPFQSATAGYDGGYAGYEEADATPLMENMPISLLINRAGRQAESKLPTDTLQPSWIALMPNIGETDLRTGDIIVGLENLDNMPGIVSTSDRFIISAAEETEFGWRLTCLQTMN